MLGIRHPGAVRAIVNVAGFDAFDLDTPTGRMMRQILGGSPDATEANPDIARQFEASEQMRPLFELMKHDQNTGQGDGHWRTYLQLCWERATTLPGFTYADFARIAVPTLILSGDRDEFCPVEQAVAAYRHLPDGELAILAGHGHYLPPAAIAATIEFLERRATTGAGTMATVHACMPSHLTPEAVLTAGHGFSIRRTQVFPAVSTVHLKVHDLGPGSADVTEERRWVSA